jgi:hypothetical protein
MQGAVAYIFSMYCAIDIFGVKNVWQERKKARKRWLLNPYSESRVFYTFPH